jgi:hypothetical protein
VAVGQATTVPPARHSTLVGSGMNPGSEVVPGGGRVCPDSGSWSSHRRYAGRAAPPVGECEKWPVILRHLGRGHGRSPDHRPHGGYSAFVGWGGVPRIGRDRQLYGVDIRRCQHATPTSAGTLTGKERHRTAHSRQNLADPGSGGNRSRGQGLSPTGDEALVCGPPHVTRHSTGSPAA